MSWSWKRVLFCLTLIGWLTLIVPLSAQDQTIHIVQAGETLFLIAQQYGVTVDAIILANDLSNPDMLRVGQRLIIPAASAPPIIYVVQPGDTLALIAVRYGLTADALAQFNHLANPNLIYIGQALRLPLPNGQAVVAPAQAQVYVVQSGDTVAQIAARFHSTIWMIAQANNLPNPNVVQVGQRLLIPDGGASDGGTLSNLPLPFRSVAIIPSVAVQGQTVQVVVETVGDVSLAGSYNNMPLFFVAQENATSNTYRALVGIHALALPGLWPLELRAVQGDFVASVRGMVQVVAGNYGVQYLAFGQDQAALLDPDLANREAQYVWNVTAQITLPGRWQGTFALPLSGIPTISAPFGDRRAYGSDLINGFHSGIDYAAALGTPVFCPAPGRVVLAEPLQVRGNAVIVDHGRGVMSGFWHLSQIQVTVGQDLAAGDLIGLVGNTGLSTGAHLHWEVRVGGVQVNPLQWTSENIP